jgi:hypothetical protein
MSVNIKSSESNQVNVPEHGSNIINVPWRERVVSAGVGGYLLGSGIKNLGRKPLKGLIQTLLGTYFCIAALLAIACSIRRWVKKARHIMQIL